MPVTLRPPIEPAAALLPGCADPLALLTVWFLRKSVYPLLWLGFIVLVVVRYDGTVTAPGSPAALWDELGSPLILIAVALMVRLLSSFAGLLIAWPLAGRQIAALPPRADPTARIGVLFDRFHAMRSLRAIRWTHHVRQEAIARLGPTGRRLARLDPALDLANLGLFVAMILVAVVAGAVA